MAGRLADSTIKNAKPRDRKFRLSDGDGLNLQVEPHGAKLWRLRFRRDGRETELSLGKYPEISLKEARERAFEERRKLARGIDPAQERHAARESLGDTFEALAEAWLAKQKHVSDGTRKRIRERLKRYAIPHFGRTPVTKLKAADVLVALRKIEEQGHHETARRVRAIVGRVLRFAVAIGKDTHDVTADLKGALTPPKTVNRAAITDPQKVGQLLRAIDGYTDSQPEVHAALRLAPLVFVRPGELRGARWNEFDLDAKEPVWRIPAERMKMRELHIVPLASQAVEILKELRKLTGDVDLVFPGLRSKLRPISDNTMNAALRRLGFAKDEQTAHGFRTIASTLLNEQGWHPDLIELQLAHAERDEVRGAYNKAQRLVERREMMQEWADYLDGLKANGGAA